MNPIAKKLILSALLSAVSLWAQPKPAPRPKFDVVSVRRCNPNGLPGPRSGEGGVTRDGSPYTRPAGSEMQCMTVGAMMNARAYLGMFGEGEMWPPSTTSPL